MTRSVPQRAGSSAVEHSTFNRMVEGSIPSRPTNFVQMATRLRSLSVFLLAALVFGYCLVS